MARFWTSQFARQSIDSSRVSSKVGGNLLKTPDESTSLAAGVILPRFGMRHSYALLVGTLRRTGVRLVRPARQGVTRNAGGEARGGLPEGASEQQTNAPRISCPSRLSLFPARQGGPGASGVRHRKGRIPGVDSVHGSFDQQSETVMKLRTFVQASAAAVIALILTGCAAQPYRSEERRVGKECGSRCSSESWR